MGRMEGKVVFVSGAARGQGRSHAVRLAEEGADIIAFDICTQIDSVPYPMATPADLGETQRLVGKTGHRIVARGADARDLDAVQSVFDAGLAEFGHCDAVVANHGIMTMTSPASNDMSCFSDCLDVMLLGTYHMLRAAAPAMIEAGRGGSIVLTSSTAALRARSDWSAGALGYSAAKAGLMGLMRLTALRLGAYGIRCNTVHPTGVDTPMIDNDSFRKYVANHREFVDAMQNALPAQVIEPVDVSELVLFLCSDESRYLTGEMIAVDAGYALT